MLRSHASFPRITRQLSILNLWIYVSLLLWLTACLKPLFSFSSSVTQIGKKRFQSNAIRLVCSHLFDDKELDARIREGKMTRSFKSPECKLIVEYENQNFMELGAVGTWNSKYRRELECKCRVEASMRQSQTSRKGKIADENERMHGNTRCFFTRAERLWHSKVYSRVEQQIIRERMDNSDTQKKINDKRAYYYHKT